MGPLGLPELLVIFFIIGLIAIVIIGVVLLVAVVGRRTKTPPR